MYTYYLRLVHLAKLRIVQNLLKSVFIIEVTTHLQSGVFKQQTATSFMLNRGKGIYLIDTVYSDTVSCSVRFS